MDDFRRRPTMEGFSRPGSLGGEAINDDEVEGHIMSDDFRREDEDTEGHASVLRRADGDDDDTEGHASVLRRADGDDDDTEGHASVLRRADGDDTEGHLGGLNRRVSEEDDDTEGHGKTIR